MSNESYINSKLRAAALDRNITPLPELHDCELVDAQLRDLRAENMELRSQLEWMDEKLDIYRAFISDNNKELE